jgi:hypothetical protein
MIFGEVHWKTKGCGFSKRSPQTQMHGQKLKRGIFREVC